MERRRVLAPSDLVGRRRTKEASSVRVGGRVAATERGRITLADAFGVFAVHGRALRWIASSHVLVVSSRMEGGANVIAEAARIGTPVLASRVQGNVGMLGPRYPGYFRLGDTRALARLLSRARGDPAFRARLRKELAARRRLFAPAEERRALLGVVRDAA